MCGGVVKPLATSNRHARWRTSSADISTALIRHRQTSGGVDARIRTRKVAVRGLFASGWRGRGARVNSETPSRIERVGSK
jgi:hypothetical protein